MVSPNWIGLAAPGVGGRPPPLAAGWIAAGDGELALGFCAMGAVRLLFPAATADPEVCGPIPESLMAPNLMFGAPREEPLGIVAMDGLRLCCPPLKGVVEAPFEFPLLPSVGTAGVIDLPFTGTDVVEADRACCPEAPPPEAWEVAVLEELAALPPGPDGAFLAFCAAVAYDARGAGALVCTVADAD